MDFFIAPVLKYDLNVLLEKKKKKENARTSCKPTSFS